MGVGARQRLGPGLGGLAEHDGRFRRLGGAAAGSVAGAGRGIGRGFGAGRI